MANLIEFRDVTYAYLLRTGESISALNNVSFQIEHGERIAIIGANGSGKSPTAKLMNGLLHPITGEVFINGKRTTESKHAAEIFSKIGLVFQNPQDQIVASLVEEDIAFGPENLGLAHNDIEQRVQSALLTSGCTHLRQRQTYLLSGGETQKVALAGVLAMQPMCIIFDETTAMLDPNSRTEVLEMMDALNQSGIAIIHITHYMDEALLANRILVFNEGRIVLDGDARTIFKDAQFLDQINLDLPFLIQNARDLHRIIPRINDFYQNPQDLLNALKGLPDFEWQESEIFERKKHRKKIIDVKGLCFAYSKGSPLEQKALHDVTFKVSQGDSMGLVGSNGSGKSTLLQHLNGIYRPQQGAVEVGPFNLVDPAVDVRALRKKVSLIFQQPEKQFFETYVGDEIAYAARTLGYAGKLVDVVSQAMHTVGLDFEVYKDRPVASLSSGQKRRVALASYIVIQPEIYLLDEPFAGLDPKTHQKIARFVRDLHRQGKTVILSTHDMRDLCQICEKVIMLHEGKNIYFGTLPHFFHQLKQRSSALQPPLELQIADVLRLKGFRIPSTALDWSTIFSAIQ